MEHFRIIAHLLEIVIYINIYIINNKNIYIIIYIYIYIYIYTNIIRRGKPRKNIRSFQKLKFIVKFLS